MRLQQLEINGFKSFPERSALAFGDGVTAIVGPNGCGKSNVIDAITWVLGEQSARSLRGERMEDVIFSGSDARKPTAAAEVRLHLSEVAAPIGGRLSRGTAGGGPSNGHGIGAAQHGTDTSGGAAVAEAIDEAELDGVPSITRDVEVGRRLYRSGESEYLIDGEVCRLRDVQDLLMDSGVGVKAYAVIEQGRIGQILGARPAERRQLIEEAAGITKYKTRRRAAELKLEAAQQNLTRVDDIIYELEKQRGALKRQAAKARRYRRLREELRRWEKVSFARRYRTLTAAIETARRRLDDVRARERGAAARLAAAEGDQARLRLEATETEGQATASREAAHASELGVGRRQQHIEFEQQQVAALTLALAEGDAELQALEARREPARVELARQREAGARCERERDDAARDLQAQEAAYAAAYQALEGLEADVEAARSEVFAAISAATALRHVVDNASAARHRISEEIAKLEAETGDVTLEAGRIAADRRAAAEAIARTLAALDATRAARVEQEDELADARVERDRLVAEVRALEQERAAAAARLRSLEELEAARAEYTDAARLVLADAEGRVAHFGSVADHLEVDRRYERAVEACLGELLQYVVVRDQQDAVAGVELARERDAGRCGFVILDGTRETMNRTRTAPDGLTPLGQVVQASGPGATAIGALLEQRWIAASFADASRAAQTTTEPVATLDGEVFRGPGLLLAGSRETARGILGTKREIKELREQVEHADTRLAALGAAREAVETRIGRAESATAALQDEQHNHEKRIVGFELQMDRADEETDRLSRKQELIATERRKAEEERDGLDARQTEARSSIARLEAEQRAADERFMQAQRRLLEARESIDALGRHVAEAKAAHATLAERAAALSADVGRLEAAGLDLEARIGARVDDTRRTQQRRTDLEAAVAESVRLLDEEIAAFESLRDEVRATDERLADLRAELDGQDGQVRAARQALETVRAELGQLEVARATAEADRSHLEASCMETLQLTLDDVRAEVEALDLEAAGAPDATLLTQPDEETGDSDETPALAGSEAAARGDVATPGAGPSPLTAEDAIAALRQKIDRLGPVNMMAIDQFDELEQRYDFLTGQRKDLLDSIVATGEAIKRIDKTTRERFHEAFTVINTCFQETFATLFGGGRAGLVLIDEADLLESGLDIIAQPPGKRLQNVQLLSGGEKALTAMALMFAIFRYRPSPFCLLDEIDAPLDDANISRFLEMLRGMLAHTQFILVTHNRKTMEIANRLYGVTMEEPGVSKLISVQLN